MRNTFICAAGMTVIILGLFFEMSISLFITTNFSHAVGTPPLPSSVASFQQHVFEPASMQTQTANKAPSGSYIDLIADPNKMTFVVRAIVTCFALLLSAWIMPRTTYDEHHRQFAVGMCGIVVGYWLEGG